MSCAGSKTEEAIGLPSCLRAEDGKSSARNMPYDVGQRATDPTTHEYELILVLGTLVLYCTISIHLCLSFPTGRKSLFFRDVTRFAARQELQEADSQVITRYSRRTSCTSLVPRDRRHPWRTQQAHSLPVRAAPALGGDTAGTAPGTTPQGHSPPHPAPTHRAMPSSTRSKSPATTHSAAAYPFPVRQ